MLTEDDEKVLSKLFYDPKIGLLSPSSFYQKIKLKGYKYDDVIEWVKKQGIDQIFSIEKQKPFHAIIGKIGDYQADTMFLHQYEHQNKKYIGIINFIDITSRKSYSYPVRSTKSEESKKVFEKFYIDCDKSIKRLTTDNGSEFLGAFQNYVASLDITHTFNQPGDHTTMGKIERFNRTIRDKINKYLKMNKTVVWIDVLPSLIENYNNTIHSSIKITPNQANASQKEQNKIIMNEMDRDVIADQQAETLHVGDTVRVLKPKKTFEKGQGHWSSGFYEIVEHVQNHYFVKNKHGVRVAKQYKYYELKKIEEVQENPTKKVKQIAQKENKKEYKQKLTTKRQDKELESTLTEKMKDTIQEKRQRKQNQKYI